MHAWCVGLRSIGWPGDLMAPGTVWKVCWVPAYRLPHWSTTGPTPFEVKTPQMERKSHEIWLRRRQTNRHPTYFLSVLRVGVAGRSHLKFNFYCKILTEQTFISVTHFWLCHMHGPLYICVKTLKGGDGELSIPKCHGCIWRNWVACPIDHVLRACNNRIVQHDLHALTGPTPMATRQGIWNFPRDRRRTNAGKRL